MEKIPVETCWAITAKVLTSFFVLSGAKVLPIALGSVKGVISPVRGRETWLEINEKIFGRGGSKFIPMVKENFNIPVEDAIGAAKLHIVAETLLTGPEAETAIVEDSKGRVVYRTTKCAWWERWKEFGVDPTLLRCDTTHQAWDEEGLKTINQKLTHKITKALPRGDSYCEFIIEFKEK